MKPGRIQVIIVYKVDRITRALPDFAKIVAVFDGQGASFVSATQSRLPKLLGGSSLGGSS